MKEDKLDIEIAASLKKKLVEASVPYELGAWEGFQKKRAARKRRVIGYWASGIAASLLLMAVGLNSVDFSKNGNPDSPAPQVAESTNRSPENEEGELPATKSDEQRRTTDSPTKSTIELKANSYSENLAEEVEAPKSRTISTDTKALANVPAPLEKTEQVTIPSSQPSVSIEKNLVSPQLRPIAESEKIDETKNLAINKSPEKALERTEETEKIIELEQQSFVAESDFPEIESEKTYVNLGMGVTPGFGSVQGENQMATASTIGVGMLVDIKLPGKLTLGSGIGVNYLSQNAQQESTVMSLGNTYPQTEKLEVRQMQVEMPVFVKYPVTRNNSISIQAGFSNFYAMNETANQENTTERQMAFYSTADALGNTSVSLRQQAVTESATLASKSGKFYPFATVNFGVNFRLLETKGANYVIMPFYNYQVKQVSGYGDTFGLFGASFKMNFGGGDK